jgi:F-type H+-transporting ATPase subunit b
MIERAKAEAEGIVRQAEADAAALVERRARMAEDKIAAAERAAIDEVRAKAASAAAAAAERLIRERMDAGADKAMVDATIAELGQR